MGTCPCSSYPQVTRKLPADFTWHPVIWTFRWAARNLPCEVALILHISFVISTSSSYVLSVCVCFFIFCLNPKAFLLRNHQIAGQDDHKLLLLSPSGHRSPGMSECEAKSAVGLQAILQTALPSTEQGCSSKQQSHSQTAHKAQEPAFKLSSCPCFRPACAQTFVFYSVAQPYHLAQTRTLLQTPQRHVYWPGGTHSIFWALLTPFDSERGDVSLWAPIFWKMCNLCSCPWKLLLEGICGWPPETWDLPLILKAAPSRNKQVCLDHCGTIKI